MRPTTYRGVITAISEIHHGGDEQTGNVRLLRTVKTYDPEQGEIVRIPIISGNAIRGVLRRKLMADMLERLDYGVVSPKLHHALHTGGVLESTGETTGSMDLGYRRELVAALPPLALLGSAIGNTMIEGQLICEMARPVCRETAWALRKDGFDDPRLDFGARSFRDFTFTTRRDDLGAEDSHQMIVTFEYIAVGTQFAHAFRLRHPSPVLASCVGHMIRLWQDDPFIGGKIAGGFGRIDLDYDGLADPAEYLEFLDAYGPTMRETLDGLAERLEGKPKPGVTNAELPL